LSRVHDVEIPSKFTTVSNPCSRFSFKASLSSRNLSLSLSLSLFSSPLSAPASLSLSTCIPRQVRGRAASTCIPISTRSTSFHHYTISFGLSAISRYLEHRRVCSRESEFSGPNYVTRRRVPSLTLRSRFEVRPFDISAVISVTINVEQA